MTTQHKHSLLLDCREAVRILGVSNSLVRKLIRQGQISVVRIGRLVRIPRDEIIRIACPHSKTDILVDGERIGPYSGRGEA